MNYEKQNLIEIEKENHSMSATTYALKNLAFKTVVDNKSAIIEILKNAYDEDADKVIIKLINNKIYIQDDGNGFSKEGFDSFKKIGKTIKIKNSKTSKGRYKTGSNGSGAYSFIRLGKTLNIASINLNENYKFSRFIDWSIIDQNPDENISILEFKETYDILSKNDFQKGVQFDIADSKLSFQELENIHKKIVFISLNNDFSYEINGMKSLNLINTISEIYKEDFCKFSFSFSFENKILRLILTKKDGNQEKQLTYHYDKDGFIGKIYGEYISIQKRNNKKYIEENYDLILDEDNYKNNFYYNDMLILTEEILGLDLNKLFLKKKSGFKFINPFGYTAVKETDLLFNESRTTIIEDEDKQKEYYIQLLKWIKNQIFSSLTNFIGETIEAKQSELKVVYNDIPISENNLVLNHNSSLKIKLPNEQLSDDIKEFIDKLNKKNKYYKALYQCGTEINLLNSRFNIKVINLSIHSLTRIFCELCFIYKIHEIFNETEIKIIKEEAFDLSNNDFKSLGSLMNYLNTCQKQEWLKLKEIFQKKTDLEKFDNIIKNIKKLNSHIHNPIDNFDSRIWIGLIEAFLKWLN